jgi:hypothetical protein
VAVPGALEELEAVEARTVMGLAAVVEKAATEAQHRAEQEEGAEEAAASHCRSSP